MVITGLGVKVCGEARLERAGRQLGREPDEGGLACGLGFCLSLCTTVMFQYRKVESRRWTNCFIIMRSDERATEFVSRFCLHWTSFCFDNFSLLKQPFESLKYLIIWPSGSLFSNPSPLSATKVGWSTEFSCINLAPIKTEAGRLVKLSFLLTNYSSRKGSGLDKSTPNIRTTIVFQGTSTAKTNVRMLQALHLFCLCRWQTTSVFHTNEPGRCTKRRGSRARVTGVFFFQPANCSLAGRPTAGMNLFFVFAAIAATLSLGPRCG